MTSLPPRFAELPTVAIVTALPKEFAAVVATFDTTIEFSEDGDPNDYRIGVIEDGAFGRQYFPIALLKKMGNNSAAASARDILRTFRAVRNLIMVGIAGGVPHPHDPENHVRLGDIVVAAKRGVVQFDNQKLSNGVAEIRDSSPIPSSEIVGITNQIRADEVLGSRPWLDYLNAVLETLGEHRPSEELDVLHSTSDESVVIPHPKRSDADVSVPKVHYGLIGSSNTLLKDAKARDALRDDQRILAIEMEGSGIADGAWTSGAGYMIVRGICDYADQFKRDVWQMYAASVAASFARHLS